MRKEAGLIAIVLFLYSALLYFQNFEPASQASLPASSAGATQDLNVSPPPPSTNINVPNSPSQNSSPTGGGQPNAASASDASCGPVVSSGSSQADYRTDQPHNSSYCATPSQPLSSLCSLSSIKLSISSPGAEEASAALAAGSTSCESPNVKRQNLCGKPCTFKTTLTGGSLSTEVTVSGECTKPNYCQGLSWTDTSGATHT